MRCVLIIGVNRCQTAPFNPVFHVSIVVVDQEGVVGVLPSNAPWKQMPMAPPIGHHSVAHLKGWCSRSNGTRRRANDHGMFGLDGIVVRDVDSVSAVRIAANNHTTVQPTAVAWAVVFDVVSDFEGGRERVFLFSGGWRGRRRCWCGELDHAEFFQGRNHGRCNGRWVVVHHRVMNVTGHG